MPNHWDEEIFHKVLDQLCKGDLYLFAGAGLSMIAGMPSWNTLIGKFADAYIKQAVDQGLAEDIKRMAKDDGLDTRDRLGIVSHLIGLGNKGQDDLANILSDSLKITNYQALEIHEKLLKLPFKGYITTNYDLCFEEATKKYNCQYELIGNRWFVYPKHQCAKTDIEDLLASEMSNFLLHMHGCLEHEGREDFENIILSPEQYSKHYIREPMIKRIFDQMLLKHILILGCSMSDPWFMHEFLSIRGGESLNNVPLPIV